MKKLILVLAIVLQTACTNLGPHTVTRDRFDYNTAISDSWKEQTLLNIVKLRYSDMPLFVEVASIVSGYSLESSVNIGGQLESSDADILSLGAAGTYTDRPTITYSPITGQQFNKSFMTPIPPRAVVFLMQTGWPADLIFPLTVEAINGYRAQVAAGANQRRGDINFYRVVSLLRHIQKSGAVDMQIIKEDDDRESTLMIFHKENISAEVEKELQELTELLHLRPGLGEYEIRYGLLPKDDAQISILTRSLLSIMVQLATQIDVPPAHVNEGRTVPSLAKDENKSDIIQLINISHSAEKPDNAFTAVRYHEHWFWIDDRDFKSKRTFAFLMILMSLMETGAKEGLPLVTIPAS